MHALDKLITARIFSDYYATLNPFMFLRDLFGLMVVAGVAIAVYRRFILKVPRLKTNGRDLYAILIVAVIMISGILLEGVKITSPTIFRAMVDSYSSLDDEELKASRDGKSMRKAAPSVILHRNGPLPGLPPPKRCIPSPCNWTKPVRPTCSGRFISWPVFWGWLICRSARCFILSPPPSA